MLKHSILFVAMLVFISACRSSQPATDKASGGASSPSWSGTMRDLQKTLSDLAPIVFDADKFKAPEQQEFLVKEIRQLALLSKSVSHDPSLLYRDPTVQFVADQFSEDLQRASQSFAEGQKGYARFQLIKVTSYCVECHTRTRQGPEFVFAGENAFFPKMNLADQAEFLIASRKFDPAFKTVLQGLKSSKDLPAFDFDRLAKLGLQISIQYKQNPKQALEIVKALEGNAKAPFYLKTQAGYWKKSIQRWQSEKPGPMDLSKLQQLLETKTSEVEAMRVIPGVLQILNSSPKGNELGETLLLAGEAYEQLNIISPLELHENYYRSCIRNLAHSAVALKCYRRLEDSTRMGYTGSSGTHMPVSVEIELQELEKLAK